jgi:osmoprotectant transport system ATP-binding protein
MEPITARAGEPRAELRRRLDSAGAAYALLLDSDDRPVGWIGRHNLDRDGTLESDDAEPGSALLERRSTLRDALSTMLASSVQLGVVVDERDAVLGVISVDAISDVLRAPADR